MAIKITLAKKPEQIDAIFKLRYQLLFKSRDKLDSSQQNQCYLNDDGRNLNRFDGYPTTSHLIVEDDKKVVGGLRLCIDSSVDIPANLVYNFRQKLPEAYKAVSCDMYCINKHYHNPKIAQGLILMASYIAASHQATHLVAPINPAIAQLMQKIGCQIIDKEMPDPATGLTMVPVILKISTLQDFFMNYVKTNKLDNFLGTFECVFYEEGDYIIRAGEKGDCVYVMVEGEATVIHPQKYKMVNILKPGDVFGEIALLTDGIRKANVAAKTPVRAMRLDKTAFMDYLMSNPEKAIAFMAQISKRTKQISD